MSSETINVEVAYATPEKQLIIPLNVVAGTSAADAVARSGIQEQFTEIDIAASKIGIFGKMVKPDTELKEGDRVEIYRPLIADPKEVRRQRAKEGKAMKKGGGDLDDDSSTKD